MQLVLISRGLIQETACIVRLARNPASSSKSLMYLESALIPVKEHSIEPSLQWPVR